MLKSSNLKSIINAVGTEAANEIVEANFNTNYQQSTLLNTVNNNGNNDVLAATTSTQTTPSIADVNSNTAMASTTLSAPANSLAAVQLSCGFLQIYEPPLVGARLQLKELVGKQNKIYIDLSAEKDKLDNDEMDDLHEMMRNVRVYREKLIKIKKQMQNIYQRTKVLKKRAANIEACKQKELQRKLQKQQQEEALIGK